ncbi:MAG: RNA-binding domain-containing protein [Candidatus Ranarchaeia archaeon]|jgi:predicted RNA binding protein with dsRBD fold (UPF0201 family)
MSSQHGRRRKPNQVEARVETLFFPSEDKMKILQGISIILDTEHSSYKVQVETHDGNQWLVAGGKSFQILAPIYNALRKHRILDTARKTFRSQLPKENSDEIDPEEIVIHFNKQHASAGKIRLSPPTGESPLGAIHLILSSSNLSYLIDWLTPRTQRGKPLENLPPHL